MMRRVTESARASEGRLPIKATAMRRLVEAIQRAWDAVRVLPRAWVSASETPGVRNGMRVRGGRLMEDSFAPSREGLP